MSIRIHKILRVFFLIFILLQSGAGLHKISSIVIRKIEFYFSFIQYKLHSSDILSLKYFYILF